MSYDVVFSLEAVDDVLQTTIASQSKAAVINASRQIHAALNNDPAESGQHLSEGLYFIDREPLRAFYTIDNDNLSVEIVKVKRV